ncbi:HNH endonuclease [Lederbergia citri]|uniref:HNH nuclease domain-containing protein n=1 Tax=Lederbergia citri TaxID=2833580 RepID=A0A942YG98_9BACI|nr:hypothetical protein [Lederbergia citri]MBS4195317.1 hypothetical protein [Lederbergia citri]
MVERECLQCGEVFEVYPSLIKKGRGKFCSISCGTTFRNINNNPTKCPEVRKKISENHADVSGKNNPMYGMKGKLAPNFKGVETYRDKAFKVYGEVCNRCEGTTNLEVHHKDRNRKNNDINNLEVLCKICHVNEHLDELRLQAELRRCKISGRFLKEAEIVG